MNQTKLPHHSFAAYPFRGPFGLLMPVMANRLVFPDHPDRRKFSRKFFYLTVLLPPFVSLWDGRKEVCRIRRNRNPVCAERKIPAFIAINLRFTACYPAGYNPCYFPTYDYLSFARKNSFMVIFKAYGIIFQAGVGRAIL